jgi:hypothetical protein
MKQAVKTLVPEEVYTDRQEFIDYFYEYALKSITRRAMSSVLLGRRRMGKTEIFKRVVNRLFFEQDHTDPKAAVPVYFSFKDEKIDHLNFALGYVENFIRWYAGFRLGDPAILSRKMEQHDLLEYVENNIDISQGFSIAIDMFKGLMENGVTLPSQRAVMLPRMVSDFDDSTIVMFLDEFQNTHMPHHNDFRIVGYMQEAVESPTCPHFVTGSAMTILSKEILGRGSLFGRFRSKPIEPLSEYWGTQLALRAAGHYQADITEIAASIIAHRCGGNPFYISAVIQQAVERSIRLGDEETINNMLATDLSSGFIWAELNDQVTKWIERINEYGITKWVLYLSALSEGDRIEPEHIQKQLAEKEGTHVSIEKIQNVLIRLSRGDLLEYMEFGRCFRKVDDPVLLDFLKAWGKFEVEGYRHSKVLTDTIKKYSVLERRINDQKGFIGEMYMSQILWNGQRKTFHGKYFHSELNIKMPDRFHDIRHRMRMDTSEDSEVDIYASTGTEIWLCESKWWETQKVDSGVVRYMLSLKEKLKDFEGREYFEREKQIMTVRLWLFAYSGVSGNAEELLKEHGIYWSTRSDLEYLVKETGLRPLPDFTK